MATAVCEPLCGSTPINTFIVTPLVMRRGNWDATVGTPDEEGALASFEPHRGRALAGWLFVQKPHPKEVGRHFKSQPARCPRRYERTRRATGILSIRHIPRFIYRLSDRGVHSRAAVVRLRLDGIGDSLAIGMSWL
jgi:hypothetical protein